MYTVNHIEHKKLIIFKEVFKQINEENLFCMFITHVNIY